MKTPKRIYFEELVGSNGILCLDYKNESDIKYIRADIADTERNEFALFCYDAGRWGGERDIKKLYEMFNSRPK
jgi:hypothetical protein